jgi:TPR repeat protein
VAASQYELGAAYVNGDGVGVDIVRGVALLRQAEAQGYRDAADDLLAMEGMSAQRGSTLAADLAQLEAEAEAEAAAAGRTRAMKAGASLDHDEV